MWIRDAQKHTDPDPEHWEKALKSLKQNKSRFFLLILLDDGSDPEPDPDPVTDPYL
jgi:hypothetical protein